MNIMKTIAQLHELKLSTSVILSAASLFNNYSHFLPPSLYAFAEDIVSMKFKFHNLDYHM